MAGQGRDVSSPCQLGKVLAQDPKRHGVAPVQPLVLGKAMIDSIRAWITGSGFQREGKAGQLQNELELALTALLIEAAYSDDHFDESERAIIARVIRRRFNLSQSDAHALLVTGEAVAGESTELFRFTRIINERLSFEERIELVEMLWEVAYADRVLDEYEDSLLRRVGGLIYVPDRERGLARQRVLKRLGLDQEG